MNLTQRQINERTFTNNLQPQQPVDFTKLLHRKPKKLDVDKDSIVNLKKWAIQRFNDTKKERDLQHQICMMHHWDGYIRAITEILEMEDQ